MMQTPVHNLTQRMQWRRLPQCPLVIALVPLTCSVEIYNFLIVCRLPRENALVPLPLTKQSLQAWYLDGSQKKQLIYSKEYFICVKEYFICVNKILIYFITKEKVWRNCFLIDRLRSSGKRKLGINLHFQQTSNRKTNQLTEQCSFMKLISFSL